MITRYVIGGCLGAASAFALFYLMHWLIHSDAPELSATPDGAITDFVRVVQENLPEPRRREPERPPLPEAPPEERVQPQFTPTLPYGFASEFQAPHPGRQAVQPPEPTDGELMAIVRVQPVYPRRALERAIEGYVIVEFTVNEFGLVEHPIVVEASPPGIFDESALKAASRFKYQPRVVSGHAVVVSGVRTQLTFSLDH